MKPTLYLMLGYPGAGKTTTSKVIHALSGAVHLWADQIRRERFGAPTYSHEENLELYDYLNELTSELLRTGQSVIFDTNFNFYKDREIKLMGDTAYSVLELGLHANAQQVTALLRTQDGRISFAYRPDNCSSEPLSAA